MKKTLLLCLLVLLALPVVTFARIGVGVGTGKIILEEEVKPGVSYELPVFSVINTGDEASDYAVSIEHMDGIEEMKPPKDWFSIKPETFRLEPGAIENVQVKLNIPLKSVPGKYFAFLSAHPVKVTTAEGSGSAAVNIAAASKLYFAVKPANIFQGLYYKSAWLLKTYSPWPQIVLSLILVAGLIIFMRKRFSFNISVGKK